MEARVLWLDDSFSPKRESGRCTGLVLGVVSAGINVICVATIDEAISALERYSFNFAFVDLNLLPEDEATGGSARFITEFLIPRKIPYARVTGDPNDVPWDQSGCFVFEKGFGHEELLQRLDYFLNRRWEKK